MEISACRTVCPEIRVTSAGDGASINMLISPMLSWYIAAHTSVCASLRASARADCCVCFAFSLECFMAAARAARATIAVLSAALPGQSCGSRTQPAMSAFLLCIYRRMRISFGAYLRNILRSSSVLSVSSCSSQGLFCVRCMSPKDSLLEGGIFSYRLVRVR
jgi:hypothetical protein